MVYDSGMQPINRKGIPFSSHWQLPVQWALHAYRFTLYLGAIVA